MKKLMVAVVAMLVAGMTQAASIAWGNTGTSKVYGLDGATAMTSALATTYALTVSLVDADGTTVATASTFNTMNAGVLSGTTLQATYTFGDGEGKYTTGDTFSIIAKMTVDGKNYEMTIGDAFAITAVNNSGTDTFTWTAGTYGGLTGTATAGTAGSWTAVPEPTSGLLLLVGGALLALRRRRA